MISKKNKKVGFVFFFFLFSCNIQKKSSDESKDFAKTIGTSFDTSTIEDAYSQYKGNLKNLKSAATLKPEQASDQQGPSTPKNQWIASALQSKAAVKVVNRSDHFFICGGKITYFYFKDKVQNVSPSGFFSLATNLSGFWFVPKSDGLLEVFAQNNAGSLVVLSQKSLEESWSIQEITGYQRKEGNFTAYRDENEKLFFIFEVEQPKWFGIAHDDPKYEKVVVENGKAQVVPEEDDTKKKAVPVEEEKEKAPATAEDSADLHLFGHGGGEAETAKDPNKIKFEFLKGSQSDFQKNMVHAFKAGSERDNFFKNFFTFPKDYVWDPAVSDSGDGSIIDALIKVSCP